MANPNTQDSARIRRSEQYVQNASFDEEFQVLALENLVFNGAGLARMTGETTLRWDTSGGSVIYVGQATPGASNADASWQIIKFDTSAGSGKYADGNTNFDNVWDNRASLTYS